MASLPISIGKRNKLKNLSQVKERRRRRRLSKEEHDHAVLELDDSDVDGPGWDKEDRQQLLYRRNTMAAISMPPDTLRDDGRSGSGT